MIPEGGDDVELRGAETTFVQIKSRRDHLGDYPESAALRHVRDLWDRCIGSTPQPDLMELVLERDVVGFAPSRGHWTTHAIDGPIRARLVNVSGSGDLFTRTSITVAGSPQEASINVIADQLNCSPVVAQMCFAELLVRVGDLADGNGRLRPEDYRGLSVSDTEGLIRDVLAAVDVGAIERAVRDGVCEPVDFLTPLYDPNFYLGVDVEPGHIAAGLVSERPRERSAVVQAIDARRTALIVGPSGAGKSAIMWEAAHALRHTVRWFRIRRLDITDIPTVRRLVRTFRASKDSPVGFVMDDVGRNGTESWGALLKEVMSVPSVVMLGSVREEDVTLIAERARAAEVRVDPDDELAERLWRELRDTGKTGWAGWREPWRFSKGLLLEYVHILTRGRRMQELLSDQVAARISDPSRSLELDILRSGAWAGTAQAEIDALRLARRLSVSEGDLSRALQRLIQEHLIRSPKPGTLAGLHQLRSEKLLRLTHQLPLPTLDASFENTVVSVHPMDLEPLIADALSQRRLSVSAVVHSLISRLEQEPDALALASALRGLGSGRIAAGVDEWLGTSEARALLPTQVGSAAMIGVSGIDFGSLPILPEIQAAANRLSEIKGSRQDDPRHLLMDQMSPNTLSASLETADLKSLNEILAALVGTPLAPAVLAALDHAPPSLLSADLRIVGSVLGTLAAIDRGIAEEWVSKVGQKALFSRIEDETAWAGVVTTEDGNEGLIVRCDLWYVAGSKQGNPHDAVVSLCELLLALCPAAEIAGSRAITSSGQLAGIKNVPLAEKRIPRANLPPPSIPPWNRRWIDAIARRVAAPSYSDYLTRGVAILDALVPALERIFDAHLRGRDALAELFKTLNSLKEATEALTPPSMSSRDASGVGPSDKNTSVTKFQNLLHSTTTNLITRFAALPDQAGSYIAWLTELISDVDTVVAEEPWHLIADGVPQALGRLKTLLGTLQSLAGESHERQEAPVVTWRARGKVARAGNALRFISVAANAAAERRLIERKNGFERGARALGVEAIFHLRVDIAGIVPWPPADVLALLPAHDIETAIVAVDQSIDSLRSVVDAKEHLTVMPLVRGIAIPAFAKSGYSSLLPDAEGGASWLTHLGLKSSASGTADLFEEVLSVAGELGSMDRLRLGLEGRPHEEIDIRRELASRLEKNIRMLNHGLVGVDEEVRREVFELVEILQSDEIDFAAEAQAALDGRPGEIVKIVGCLSLVLIENEFRQMT
ncbi:MAG: hypothetical protein OXE53_13315 [Deltaproteobacteria bacterium]|nr:hypothetical protein [Deltaproteobacteria bacterium]